MFLCYYPVENTIVNQFIFLNYRRRMSYPLPGLFDHLELARFYYAATFIAKLKNIHAAVKIG